MQENAVIINMKYHLKNASIKNNCLNFDPEFEYMVRF